MTQSRYEEDVDGELVLYLRDISNPDDTVFRPIGWYMCVEPDDSDDDSYKELHNEVCGSLVMEIYPSDGDGKFYKLHNRQ